MENDLASISIILATLLGPIFAVLVTRSVDLRRQRLERKLSIFRSLMKNRRTDISDEFMSALNMVEVDFYKSKRVLSYYYELMRHFGTPVTEGKDWNDKANRLKARLLYEMGKDVGYSLEQLDILEGGYLPRWVVDSAEEEKFTRRKLLEVLSGNQPLTVVMQGAPYVPGPFNPPPPPV